jgi:hypothetical protein
MCDSMSDESPSDVLGSLPRTRPHRRSQRRASRPVVTSANGGSEAVATTAAAKAPERAKAKPASRAKAPAPRAIDSATGRKRQAPRPKQTRMRQPAQPGGTPVAPRKPVPSTGADVLGTAVQAAAELAEIGLSVSARALRRAVSRLPRP